MMLALSLAPLAEQDLLDAADWYDAQQPGLGDEFLRSVEASFARIQRLPMSFPSDEYDIRSALLHRFPYSVRFRVQDERIEVIAVWHGHRDPKGWTTRTG
ncbi:MAG: type II toxin-antitoxin system RelE/ParE family toxin [Myxococcota bacterium]